MANKKTKPTKETVKAEKSNEVLTEVSLKKNKKAVKEESKKVDQKKAASLSTEKRLFSALKQGYFILASAKSMRTFQFSGVKSCSPSRK
jgi:hypothetical protein